MRGAARSRKLAVLETSFWTAAHRAEVAANCLDFYQIVVPRAVEAEIFAVHPDAPRREYPYATLFRHLRGQMHDPPPGAPAPLPVFGSGEAEAIPLAGSMAVELLINEHRAGLYATRLGIIVVTVPGLIVLLRSEGVISERAARRKLELIKSITAQSAIDAAQRTLDAL